MKELILYCDESIKDGDYYSNFYGGALTSSDCLEEVIETLNQAKVDNNLYQEIKWTKVTESYLDKYTAVMGIFFDLISQNKIKVRIMFSQNAHEAKGLTQVQIDNRFFLLYYQFIKHAFGLRYCNPPQNGEQQEGIHLRIFFDLLPDKESKCLEFKEYIQRLCLSEDFKVSKINIRPEDVAEVDSHKHVILQCMDVVLGAMQFRLNNLHLVKQKGSRRRGKKTRAKEALYKYILQRIRAIYPGFNIGECTGIKGNYSNRWLHPYRHWKFIPGNSNYNGELTKKRKCPAEPT